MAFILKNNQILPENEVNISFNDRSFLFGDGIFETCKIFNGQIYNFSAHQNRLNNGLKALKISANITNLEKNCQKLIAKNNAQNGLIRISISRGSGSKGYAPHNCQALIIAQIMPQRQLPNFLNLTISQIQKPNSASLPVNYKINNCLPQILSKIKANEEGFFDAVMLNEKGFISETSSANIFWIKNGEIFTPAKNCDILLGCIREKLLKISPIKINQVTQKISSLKNADEIFITNSAFLLAPIDEFMGRKLQKNISQSLLKILKKDLPCK